MAKWSKQTYELVADILKDADTIDKARVYFAEAFTDDNDRFDYNRFMEAAGEGK